MHADAADTRWARQPTWGAGWAGGGERAAANTQLAVRMEMRMQTRTTGRRARCCWARPGGGSLARGLAWLATDASRSSVRAWIPRRSQPPASRVMALPVRNRARSARGLALLGARGSSAAVDRRTWRRAPTRQGKTCGTLTHTARLPALADPDAQRLAAGRPAGERAACALRSPLPHGACDPARAGRVAAGPGRPWPTLADPVRPGCDLRCLARVARLPSRPAAALRLLAACHRVTCGHGRGRTRTPASGTRRAPPSPPPPCWTVPAVRRLAPRPLARSSARADTGPPARPAVVPARACPRRSVGSALYTPSSRTIGASTLVQRTAQHQPFGPARLAPCVPLAPATTGRPGKTTRRMDA